MLVINPGRDIINTSFFCPPKEWYMNIFVFICFDSKYFLGNNYFGTLKLLMRLCLLGLNPGTDVISTAFLPTKKIY